MSLGFSPNEPIFGQLNFPVKVAAIDAGSNAIRFTIASFTNAREYEVLVDERAPVRLGHGVFVSGKISKLAFDAALAAFVSFRRTMDEHGVQHYSAVATSAVRESSNGDEFIEKIRDLARIELQIITGSDEARLVYIAAAHKIAFDKKQWLIAELGGGSVEVSLVDGSGILATECHSIGAVRLLEELAGSDEDPGRFRRLLKQYISMLKVPAILDRSKLAGFVATGGNIESLAKLTGAVPDSNGVCVVPVKTIRSITESIYGKSFRERVEDLGLREDRADVILPAAAVYLRIAELIKSDEIIVPFVGVREGAMFDLVDNISKSNGRMESDDRELMSAALAIGRKFFFDEPHAVQVSKLALMLFDQLKSLHGLSEGDRRILMAASLLHDIGTYIDLDSHHKHSLYLIMSAKLPDFTPRQMLLVANVARYHRKAEPSPSHKEFVILSAPERDKVCRLASMLRIADVFDREHLQKVYSVKVETADRAVRMIVQGSGVLTIHRSVLSKKSKMFTSVFNVKLTIHETKYEREEFAIG